MKDLVGSVFGGKYRVGEHISSGGMASIYRCTHTFLKKQFALKVLSEEMSRDNEMVKMFFKEAETSASLDHSNIVKVSDFGQEGAYLYIVMQLIPGRTLDKLIEKKGRLNPEEAAYIELQLLSALSYAHNRGLVHRDVKPGNIMLTESNKLYMLDFGIAVLADTASKMRFNVVPGTPDYMAPEQLKGRVDERSDLYSAGVVLYEMLSGRVPFQDDNILSLQMRIIKDAPPPLSQLVPGLDERLTLAVRHSLSKIPSDRYQSAYEFATDLLSLALTSPPPNYFVEPPALRKPRRPVEDEPHVEIKAPHTTPTATTPAPAPATKEGDRVHTQFIPVVGAEAVPPKKGDTAKIDVSAVKMIETETVMAEEEVWVSTDRGEPVKLYVFIGAVAVVALLIIAYFTTR